VAGQGRPAGLGDGWASGGGGGWGGVLEPKALDDFGMVVFPPFNPRRPLRQSGIFKSWSRAVRSAGEFF